MMKQKNSGLGSINLASNSESLLGGTDNNLCDGIGAEFRIFLVSATGKPLLNNTTVSGGCTYDSGGGGIAVIGAR